ncbi:MAG: anti-sigma factor [Anaerolineae bacterium]|nr:anti-sigma factor [Anaerolineae bacterium]
MNATSPEPLYDLIPAYALGALDSHERAAVEALLTADEAARALLDEYRQVAEALVFAAPAVAAPDHLGEDFLRRLEASRTVQLPAARSAVSGGPAPVIDRPAPVRRASAAVSTAYRLRRYLLPLAAALAILVGLVAALVQTRRLPDDGEHLYAFILADGVELRVPITPGEGQDVLVGEMIVAARGCEAVIRVEHLPVLGPDATYQLWLRGVDGAVASGGLFAAGAGDVTYIVLPVEDGTLEQYASFGVSREPAGGSPYEDQPTGPRMFLVEVQHDQLPTYEGG